MIKRALWLLMLFFPLVVFGSPVYLRDMHVSNLKNKTTFIFDLSGKAQYHAFMMHHPDRFVVDINCSSPSKKLFYRPHALSLVTGFRYAAHKDGIFRMVFEIEEEVSASASRRSLSSHHPEQFKVVFFKKNDFGLSSPIALLHHSVVADIAAAKKSDLKLRRSVTENKSGSYRNVVIVIDPGHGGKDPGAIGSDGTKEKNVVLLISKKLRDWINQQPGYHAVLTRSGDYYLTLRQRLRIARKDKADMFVAIHADTWRNPRARGVSIFALSQRGATSEAARWLATRENASELMGGVDLNDRSNLLKSVLINLSQAATIRSSLLIGKDVMYAVKPIARLHHNKVEQAAFVVLKSPDIPSLLVETGFLSNYKEVRLLRDSAYQNSLARSIKRGICNYFSHYPPRKTWLSYWRKNSKQYAQYINYRHA